MKLRHILTLVSAFALTACGGGGSTGGPTSPPPPINNSDLPIDDTNSKPVMRVAYSATTQTVDTGAATGGTVAVDQSGGGLAKPSAPSSFGRTLSGLWQKVPLPPQVLPCGISGTVEITLDVVDPNVTAAGMLSAGDRIVAVSTDCVDVPGETVNGTMDMTVVSFSGDLVNTGLFQMTMDVLLIDFSVTTSTDTITSNGDATVSVDTLGSPLFAMSIAGNSLSTATSAVTEIITTYSTAQTVDTSVVGMEPFTLTASGTVDSSQLSGIISYSTPVTFRGVGAAYPFEGQLLVTGAGNSKVRLTAQSDTQVLIETDADGDNTYESSEVTTWDDIAGQLPTP